ncbi:probable serine threonine- kinase DDB_G0291350 [Olea europaea subsp. europaea]|uniref:Probable serine threonine- kinase DDB_G0291350 n=1 Tax=Olea europaea subsp. europaea TaxID=158383 RepID=A0A8S0QLC9_OLEEU|nr:probable serine threonine- kinase DDB_G0291350 [Olea europaea subsp. europaea]
MGCSFLGLNALNDAVNGGGGVWINENRFRIVRQLGEGGFAYVFLVKEVIFDSSNTGISMRIKDSSHVSEWVLLSRSGHRKKKRLLKLALPILRSRSNVDLKNILRNLNCMANVLGSRHRAKVSYKSNQVKLGVYYRIGTKSWCH